MRTVSIQSATRVDFAGGTLDLWPLFALIGETTTTNLSISIFTEAVLKVRPDKKIIMPKLWFGAQANGLSFDSLYPPEAIIL